MKMKINILILIIFVLANLAVVYSQECISKPELKKDISYNETEKVYDFIDIAKIFGESCSVT